MNALGGVIAAAVFAVGTGTASGDTGDIAGTFHSVSPGVMILNSIGPAIAGAESGRFAVREGLGSDEMPIVADRDSTGVGSAAHLLSGGYLDVRGDRAESDGETHTFVAGLGNVSPAVEVPPVVATSKAPAAAPAVPHESSGLLDLLVWLLGAVGFIVVWMVSVIWILTGVRRFLAARG